MGGKNVMGSSVVIYVNELWKLVIIMMSLKLPGNEDILNSGVVLESFVFFRFRFELESFFTGLFLH